MGLLRRGAIEPGRFSRAGGPSEIVKGLPHLQGGAVDLGAPDPFQRGEVAAPLAPVAHQGDLRIVAGGRLPYPALPKPDIPLGREDLRLEPAGDIEHGPRRRLCVVGVDEQRGGRGVGAGKVFEGRQLAVVDLDK